MVEDILRIKQERAMKKIVIFALVFVLVIICGIQKYKIQEYKQSEKLWREKLDTCMNRNERIYNQLYEFQDIRIKQLKGELPK